MYEIMIKTHFSSAHQLRDYPGDCERLHGHNYHLEVFCQCKELDTLGMGIDFKILKAKVKELVSQLDHYNLNENPDFQTLNPSAENIARWFYDRLKAKINNDRVWISRVNIWETEGCRASYFESQK